MGRCESTLSPLSPSIPRAPLCIQAKALLAAPVAAHRLTCRATTPRATSPDDSVRTKALIVLDLNDVRHPAAYESRRVRVCLGSPVWGSKCGMVGSRGRGGT